MKKLPDFKSDEEEMVFWETHEPEDYLMEPREEIILHFCGEVETQGCAPSPSED